MELRLGTWVGTLVGTHVGVLQWGHPGISHGNISRCDRRVSLMQVGTTINSCTSQENNEIIILAYM